MFRAPWDTELWSHLCVPSANRTSNPIQVDGQIVRENLAKRKNHRLKPCERQGSHAHPYLPVPPSGEWTGDYEDVPSVPSLDHQQVQYNIVFKPDGSIEGFGCSNEGRFIIQGVYNLCKQRVAWRQLSPTDVHQGCGTELAAEFFGEISILESRTQITGSFVTNHGRYCIVRVVAPRAPEISSCTANAESEMMSRHLQTIANVEATLPRLLGSPCRGTVSKEDKPCFCLP